MSGKIALVKRGDITFEEKAMNAKNAGAIACIIYNNIDGDILMSMGKTEHIPTVSISRTDGAQLAKVKSGKMAFHFTEYMAGPFMSDFSSWGPTADLKLKPEITAHGGNILSAVPNGRYDELSGTSMATPNLCGIMILIRSYLKDKYPSYTWSEINSLANQLLMSTATIIRNEEGNPYSPRKQGAGLASMRNVVSAEAYLSVDGSDRPKLELGDDKNRTGVYDMQFNVVNFSDRELTYRFDFVGMTETVSASDETFVAETPYILSGNTVLEVNGAYSDGTITVGAGQTATLKVTYTLSNADKQYIEERFPYGMYVEGFAKLLPTYDDGVQLNIPFLAFYGDWTEAPLFDKTYYEVEEEAHNNAIDDEDKLKADYYATTPYGSYYYNYIIPLGTYLYDIDPEKYDAIPASREHIAISNFLGTIDGIGSVYAGLLRNAKTMTFTITDKVTGEVVFETVDYNATKAHSYGGSPIPYYDLDKISAYKTGLVNNREYEFKMVGKLDYGDGGLETNMRNAFSFDFFMDNEAPVLKEVSYEKIYDKSLKKDRFYLTMTIYDNHYVQSITPIVFTSSSSYTLLTKTPIPVYSERGTDNTVRFEITDFLDDAFNDGLITSGLAFSIDDYALNSNIYVCQLPGTDGEFKFTKNGETDGTDLIILSVNEGDVVDLTRYLATTDESLDADKDYLNHLAWSSSNEKVVKVNRGSIVAMKEGRATVSVKEQMDLRQAVIIINVKPKDSANAADTPADDDVDGARIKEARFTYFDTLFAYSRAAQTSEIHSTGSRVFINSLSGINFYPGEKIKLSYEMKPWYVTDKYDVTFKSTNPAVATVDEEGVVTGLKEGSTTISLSIAGSNIVPTVRVTIKNPFVIENRTLIAYKGLGGNVVIPDDEGILYVGAFAFCLYDTDYSIEVSEEDYDKNKIPASNTTVTSVVIPDGVQEIQKYAFYNCTGLREVAIPNDVKFIRDYAFYNCAKLERVVYNGELVTDPAAKTYADRYVYSDGKFTFKSGSAPTSLTGTKAEVIGQNAFAKCVSLDNFDFSNVYAIGMRAFDGCTSLSYADLTALRNAEKEVFRGCSSLERAVLDEDTKLSYAMFVRSGLKSVDVYNIDVDLPAYIFAQCPSLTEINIRNGLVSVGKGAFSECDSLVSVNFEKGVGTIGELAFYNSKNLASVKLPEGRVKVEINAFRGCEGLTVLEFGETTEIVGITGALFKESGITRFVVDAGNPYYKAEGGLLLSANGKKIVFAGAGNEYGAYTVDAKYDEIGDSAFAGTDITELTIINKDIKIGSYAFAECSALTKVIFPAEAGLLSVGESAFNGDIALVTVENLGYVTSVGQLAFAGTGITEATVAENAVYGNGAFMASALETVTIGKNARFGLSAFRENRKLTTVNMPAEGNVTFGAMCFAGDVKLETIDLSKTDGIIASETFYGCSKLRTVNLTGVEVVGDYAFADCRNLSDLTITDGLTEIGEGAFSRNTENGGAPCFTEIYLPSTLVKIGVGAFIGCGYLTDVVLPDSLGEESNEYAFGKPVADDRDFRYGDSLFMYCESLRSVTLPAGAEAIGMYAFYGCAKLTTINNVGSVKTIDDYAFAACSQLASFDFSSVVTVGEGAFAKSALGGYVYAAALKEVEGYAFQNTSFVYFNAPALEKIGEAAFQLNPKLKQFELSENVSEIGLMPFYGCTALEKFLCDGSEDGEVNEYAKIVDGVLYTRMKSGKFQLHSVPAAKKTSILEVEEGTYRIETYAGNENDNIAYVVLPDSLRLIGNYAFYGCDGLTTVEFKSVRAPRLEDSYNQYISLNENDPGYELIHNVFDIFGLELYYCNFIDVLGKKEPINMVLPANKDITGYDGIAYEGYFGKVSSSRRSDYVAMEEELIDFIDYAEKIVAKSVVTLADEALVNDALTAYKALTQEGTDYGYGREEWFLMIGAVNEAKNRITELKIRTATYKAQQIQKEIYALPAVFTVDKLTTLKNLSERINALDLRDKNILDMSRYNAFVASYEEYRKAIEEEAKLFGSIGGYKTNEQ
ncbi:MAG: leucine-rich repeat protein [Christensenellales bacterium]